MDDFFNPPAESDPAADFLAREKALLGDEFATGGDATSFDKDFEQSASAFPDLDGDDDGLQGFVSPAPTAPAVASIAKGPYEGGMGSNVSVTGTNEFAQFESEYPEVELPAAPQHNGFGAAAPDYNQQPSMFSGAPQPKEEESEFIKSWKSKQAEEIARREEASSKKKEETIVKAQNAIDNFYKEYNAKKEKNIAKNKEEEAEFKAAQTDALSKGTTWDRICTMVDLQDSRSKTTTKSKQDLARFKSVLLDLRREGDAAPGAGGY